MAQAALVVGTPRLQSRLLARRQGFDSLFEGYDRLQAVSYVVTPDLLLHFFDKRGFSEVEVVVGENLTDQYRQALSQKGRQVTAALAELVEQGKLRIFVPRRTIHSKLYVLQRDGQWRVIQGSANLTETARRGANQVNYVWYVDLAPDDPWLEQALADYRAHLRDCSLFMGDLIDLFRQSPERDREELIDAWLKGRLAEEDGLEERRVLQELTARSLQSLEGESVEPIFSVELPDQPATRQRMQRRLAVLNPVATDRRLQVNAVTYLRYVQEAHGVPLMRVDLAARKVLLGMDGLMLMRSEPPPDGGSVDQALQHIEDYVNTVDWGHCLDPQFAKTSIFEAMLYLFAAPFAHEHMRARRRAYALVDSRGPQALYIFGQAQNGKSTFVRFALRLLTGRHILPIPGAQFSKTRIQGAAALGSAFPLVFDDVDVANKGRVFEGVLKPYWEVWWREECVAPQLVLTANAESLKPWAKSRLKRIDFDVQFAPDEEQKRKLNQILEANDPIFEWFAFLYMNHLERGASLGEDELSIARDVVKDLYRRAGRPLPSFFPEKPVEQLYNPGRRAWHDVLYRLRKASLTRDGDQLHVDFKDDMQHPEVRAYAGHLPQVVKHKIKGKTIVIESPGEFDEWLGSRGSRSEGPLRRLFARIKPGK
jgi:hypothetical protein